jgi:hypothetical protein
MRTGKLVNCFKTRRFREGRSDDRTVIIIVADKFYLKPETVHSCEHAKFLKPDMTVDPGISNKAPNTNAPDERDLVAKSTMGRTWSQLLYRASFVIIQVFRRYGLY